MESSFTPIIWPEDNVPPEAAIMDDVGGFGGSFAMLTDINERKEMELFLEESNRQLTELSNKDSLTGIANRRHFDAFL